MSNSRVRYKLPSLMALRAFDAASRTESFTRAADDLFITQSAVSRHIRNLESDLNMSLFHRKGRELSLTTEGEALRKVVEDAFDRMSTGIELIRRAQLTPTLTVGLLPSLAAKWLVPRIAEFTSEFPDVEVRMHCSRVLSDFKLDGLDIAIRYGRGQWDDCHAELLMEERIMPVCSPEWLKTIGDKPDLSLLASMPLLEGDIEEQWDDWLAVAGVEFTQTAKTSFFTDDNALIQAAIDGQGFILGRSALVARDIAENRLVAPFTTSTPAVYSYWIVTQNNDEADPVKTGFRDFLHTIAKLTP